jgi:phosphopantothenate synthetase
VDAVVEMSQLLPAHIALVIVHRKPGREREIQAQLNACITDRRTEFPVSGDTIQFPL